MSIGDVSTQDGSYPDSPNPIGDIVGGGDGALVQLICQIYDQIGGYTVIRHAFENLVHCTKSKKKQNSGKMVPRIIHMQPFDPHHDRFKHAS